MKTWGRFVKEPKYHGGAVRMAGELRPGDTVWTKQILVPFKVPGAPGSK